MPLSIYPPTLASTQESFLYNTPEGYPIYFTLQAVTNYDSIGHIQIRIVRQSNNRSIVDTSKYPDGIIYKPASSITSESSGYSISISDTDLAETWKQGYLYKVQLRFGTTAKFSSTSNFATWKQQQIENGTFSEWSTVMIIKAIGAPTLTILNAEAVNGDIIAAERTEQTLTPLFSGTCELPSASKEVEDQYKFDIYSGNTVEDTTLIETSGWLRHNGIMGAVDSYRFKQLLTNQNQYTVIYSIITNNGYSATAVPYTFTASRTSLGMLEGLTIKAVDNTPYCKDNGCIQLYLNATTATTLFSGAYVICRTSEASNYQEYEDLKYLIYNQQTLVNHLCFTDYTVESGVKYRYAIQQENAAGLRTDYVFTTETGYHVVNFNYAFLYHNDLQLKLQFNQKMSSFKHTTLRAKQDTIGDKYPHLVQNGNAYYAEFPVSGLITFQTNGNVDIDRWENDSPSGKKNQPYPSYLNSPYTFFTPKSDGMYYQGERVIGDEKFELFTGERVASGATDSSIDWTISTELTDNNIYIERRFREKVEEFLNNFDYKLYKSPTEGNIVVALMNVSMTPVESLGRMLYEFSATAYEVIENTIENLDEHGIISIGKFESLSTDEVTYSFGQVGEFYNFTAYTHQFTIKDDEGNDVVVQTKSYNRDDDGEIIASRTYTSGTMNIYSLIKQQEEISIGGGYKLKCVRSIWVEPYPRESLNKKLNELYAKRAEIIDEGGDTTEIDEEIVRYTELDNVLAGPAAAITKLAIDGREILVLPNKLYTVADGRGITSIELIDAVAPVLINYVCDLTQTEDQSVGVVSAVDSSRIWGQVSGVFTDSDGYLKIYNYDYANSKTYQVFDQEGQSYNYNVYRTTNLFNVIEETIRGQVETMYKTTFALDSQNRWTDGTIYYMFGDISSLDIEADAGTVMYIGKSRDGSDAQRVQIGITDIREVLVQLFDEDRQIIDRAVRQTRVDKTCKIFFTPMDNLIRYIRFDRGSFAVVNYVCLTTQQKIIRVGGDS